MTFIQWELWRKCQISLSQTRLVGMETAPTTKIVYRASFIFYLGSFCRCSSFVSKHFSPTCTKTLATRTILSYVQLRHVLTCMETNWLFVGWWTQMSRIACSFGITVVYIIPLPILQAHIGRMVGNKPFLGAIFHTKMVRAFGFRWDYSTACLCHHVCNFHQSTWQPWLALRST